MKGFVGRDSAGEAGNEMLMEGCACSLGLVNQRWVGESAQTNPLRTPAPHGGVCGCRGARCGAALGGSRGSRGTLGGARSV